MYMNAQAIVVPNEYHYQAHIMRVIALHIRIHGRVVAVGDKGAGTGNMARSEVSRV